MPALHSVSDEGSRMERQKYKNIDAIQQFVVGSFLKCNARSSKPSKVKMFEANRTRLVPEAQMSLSRLSSC